MTPATKRSPRLLLCAVGGAILAFAAGSQVRSTQSRADEFRSMRKIESVQFEGATATSSNLKDPAMTARVVALYTETDDGVHDKVYGRETPGEGTFVTIPGTINGVKVRIVVVVGPRE